MTDFQINDEDLTGFQGKVAVITGGSSGIGLATAELLLSLGASVVSGDVQASPTTGCGFHFVHADVRNWADLVKLFKTAKEKHGKIDYVFANAGVGPRADYLALEVDQNGDPKEPNNENLDVNFNGLIKTATLAAHYMKVEGGNLVIMASTTGMHPMRAVDYSTAKAGVLGFARSFAHLMEVSGLPIRVNGVAPSWTDSQILPDVKKLLNAVSVEPQPASAVARCVAYLMASNTRHGDMIYICDSKFKEVEKSTLNPAYTTIRGDSPTDDEVLGKIFALAA